MVVLRSGPEKGEPGPAGPGPSKSEPGPAGPGPDPGRARAHYAKKSAQFLAIFFQVINTER